MRLMFRSKASESAGYRPDIDGLRAIAVLSVVLYHARTPGFSGGFVGVDVFFVISGYLITRVILKDIERGQFSFWTFYERRVRRIFPALFVVASSCTALGAVLFPPQQFADFGKSLLAMLGFVSNVYFKRTGGEAGYFEPASGTQFLLHTWSLSVEEQFYIFFPMLLLLLTRYAMPYRKAAMLLLGLLSFGWCAWLLKSSPVAAFYLLPGRAWELLVGALFALKIVPALSHPVLRTLAGAAGLAAIVYGIVALNDSVPFPGVNALYPCMGTCLVIYAGEDGPSLIKKALGFGPMVFLGAISYSLYLWHWPALSLARYYYATNTIAPRLTVEPLLAAFVLSILSFLLIEAPFRARSGGIRSSVVIWRGVAMSGGLAVIALLLVASGGLPKRFSEPKRSRMAANYAMKSEFFSGDACKNWHTDPLRYEDANFCQVGPAERKKILLWGDSHVLQLYPLLKKLQETDQLPGKSLVLATSSGCPPTVHYNVTLPGSHCDHFSRFALQRAAMNDVDTVFIEFSPWWAMNQGSICVIRDDRCAERLPGDEAERRVVEEVEGHIRELRALGKRVIVGLPFPIYSMLIPDYQIRKLALERFGVRGPDPFDLLVLVHWQLLKEAAKRAGAEIYDPRETLCPNGVCLRDIDGVSIYSDHTHFAASQLAPLQDGLLKSLRRRE